MIAHKTLQPSLLLSDADSTIVEKSHLQMALQNDSPNGESPAQPRGNSLQADPLEDEYRQARRRAMARTLCQNGVNGASWELANKLAQSWGMSCSMFGIDRPADDEGDFRRQRVGAKR